MLSSHDFVIVGGGISGLGAAFELARSGADLLLIEAREQFGGSIRSEVTPAGFVLNHGPNTVTTHDPELLECFHALGIAGAQVTADRNGARRFILLNGQPELIPMSPGALLATPLLSMPAKLRVLAEPLLPQSGASDESVAAFFSRRIGRQPVQRLLDPFVAGVYAGDPAQMSMQAAFPQLWEAEQRSGSMLLGMISGRKAAAASGKRMRSVLFNFSDGLQAWPRAVGQLLGPQRAWTNAQLQRLERAGNGWRLLIKHGAHEETVLTRSVILATPAYVSAGLLEALDGELAGLLRSIPYPPVSVVHLGYRRADVTHALDGFGVLVPAIEQREVLGILWTSTLFGSFAPGEHLLTTSFVGGARQPELALRDDQTLIESLIREHAAILGARGLPVLAHVTRWEHAIPQYTAGHNQRIAALARITAAYQGLHLLGNYRGGVSVEKCWNAGRALAGHMLHSREPYAAATSS